MCCMYSNQTIGLINETFKSHRYVQKYKQHLPVNRRILQSFSSALEQLI